VNGSRVAFSHSGQGSLNALNPSMPSRAGNRAFPREIDTLRRHFTLHQAGYFGVSIETRGLSCSFLLPSEDATLQRHHGDDRPGRAFSIDA